ncbi:S2-RNase [Pyrus ussuriensis x Pyrus communis]|uniref:S2-RNase n=1 Tax=Pyrus ussuriensis x Pyrus communis TaxID=2448454 RepID=A0A5N5FB39_9ROSA|nr:S2-RNase [Pyrus ussuriensis x Pyrus communis]
MDSTTPFGLGYSNGPTMIPYPAFRKVEFVHLFHTWWCVNLVPIIGAFIENELIFPLPNHFTTIMSAEGSSANTDANNSTVNNLIPDASATPYVSNQLPDAYIVLGNNKGLATEASPIMDQI